LAFTSAQTLLPPPYRRRARSNASSISSSDLALDAGEWDLARWVSRLDVDATGARPRSPTPGWSVDRDRESCSRRSAAATSSGVAMTKEA
jgi:hypothetical protein